MAKVRASLVPPRLSAGDMSEVSSSASAAELNIHVRGTRKTRSGSDASSAPTQSTPATSLPEESVSDAASDKQAMDAQLTGMANDEGNSSRRTSRHRPEPGSYNVNSLLGIKRNKSVETLKKKESRSFSGQTLVNDAPPQDESADTPRRKLLDDLKTLDPDWDVNNVDDDASAPSSSDPAAMPKRRKSLLQLDRLTGAVGNGINIIAKKVLGKRSRDETETSSTGGRRQSTRISSITFDQIKKDEDEQDVAERPSKMARVASSLSMHNLSSTLHLTKSKPAAIARPRERPVKKYQRQGLYVGQNPDDYDPVTKKPKKRKSDPNAKIDKPFLPLPMFGFLDRERNFVIPYGVFAPQWRERGTEKPKDWGKINKNRFVGDAKDEWRTVKLTNSLCACKSECGEDCWNRAMGVECDKNNCNVGPDCSNRDFSELSARMARAAKYDKKSLAYIYNAGVEVVKTSDRGFGVRACRAFEPNEIITEYTGEIITQNEGYRRVKEDYAGKSDYYQMEFDQGMILDATRGSLARFVNHSCDPNCAMVKRNVSGQPRMALFAGDNGVMTGEELTYDYNFDPYSTTNVQACLCGSSNCRQFLGPKPAGEKKPSSKKEQLDMAMNLKRTASGASKRKASELHDNELEVEIPKELIKKRKVPQMSKGWAYVDEDMERQRQEEAEKDRVLRQLQRDGILSEEVKVSRPKYPSRSAVAAEAGRKLVIKAREMISSSKPSSRPTSKGSSKASIKPSPKASIKSSIKAPAKPSPKVAAKAASKATSKFKESAANDDDEPRPMKSNVISRGLGSIKRKGSSASAAVSEKRKSTLSQSNSFRQSTLSFNAQPRSVSGTSGEALLRTSSNTSATEMANKRASFMSRTSSKSKRNSTVRMVSDDE